MDPGLLDRVREAYHDETVREAHYRVLGPHMRGMLLEQAGYQGPLDLVGHEAANLAQQLGTDQYLTLEISAREDAGLSLTATRSRAGLWEKPIVRIQAMAPPEVGALTQAVSTLVREAMDPDRLPVDEPEDSDAAQMTRPAETAKPGTQTTPGAESPETSAPAKPEPTVPQPTVPQPTTPESQATTSPEGSSDQETSSPPAAAANPATQAASQAADVTPPETPADGEVIEAPRVLPGER